MIFIILWKGGCFRKHPLFSLKKRHFQRPVKMGKWRFSVKMGVCFRKHRSFSQNSENGKNDEIAINLSPKRHNLRSYLSHSLKFESLCTIFDVSYCRREHQSYRRFFVLHDSWWLLLRVRAADMGGPVAYRPRLQAWRCAPFASHAYGEPSVDLTSICK